ncbi:MAG TPA: hypothetical protein EYO80_00360 [Candidatus Marinimicrobia bacterium]|jgi:hypothetical protein|nr:hypothetical protein [Candidatus Neomarinimicrobiota bacterium]
MKRIILIFSMLGFLVQAQTKRDPRMVGMAGAYTTIADGIFCVGFNPGIIGLQQNDPFMIQAFQLDVGMLGNFFSIQNIAQYSGDTLDTADKDALFDQLEASDGMAFFVDTHMPIPFMNISKGNMAFTSNNIILQNYKLPMGLLELIFYGNGQRPTLDLEFNYEIVGLNEYGFSFGIPFKSMSWGVTAKYLQGLFYLGIDEDSSSATLITDDLGIYGSGKYIIRQGVGGAGFGLDIGVISRPYNGWQFGASFINMVGSIKWNQSGGGEKPSSINPLMSKFYPFTFGEDTLDLNESILFTFNIDTIRMDKMGNDSLFTNETIFFVDTLANGKRPEFVIRYPATFRLGASKKIDNFLFATDLVAGFENKYYARQQWKWAMAVEWNRIPAVPMRIGYSWAGGEMKELAMGFGVKKGPVIFDLGFSFRNGMWLHTMKGFNFSFGFTWVGKSPKKSEKEGSSPSSKK